MWGSREAGLHHGTSKKKQVDMLARGVLSGTVWTWRSSSLYYSGRHKNEATELGRFSGEPLVDSV